MPIRRHQLRNSLDPRVRRIHQDFSDAHHRRHSLLTLKAWKRPSLREEWKECVHEQSLLAEVKTNKIKGNCQIGTAGVGFGPRKLRSRSLSAPKREREEMLRVFTEMEEEKRLVKALTSKSHFSEWLRWDGAMAVDLSWKRLLYHQSDSYLHFALNSIEDTFPTPSVLKCWRQASAGDGKCPLGCGYAGTLKHILCGCKIAINETPQSRITWRHDSILLAIHNGIQELFKAANAKSTPTLRDNEVQTFSNPLVVTSFKSASGNTFNVPHAATQQDVLARASDWKVQFDLDMSEGMSKQREGNHSAGHRTSLPFPPEIAVVSGTGSRADGVIWSMSRKTVIWIELASPWEENMSKRHFEKKNKYNQLALDLRNPHRVGGAWTVFPFEVEVGARGAINEQPWSYIKDGMRKMLLRRTKNIFLKIARTASVSFFLPRKLD